MIKIKVPVRKDLKERMMYNYILPKDRKYIFDLGIYFYLQDDLHFWLIDHNIQYNLVDKEGWYIIFKNKKDAILFKLSWC